MDMLINAFGVDWSESGDFQFMNLFIAGILLLLAIKYTKWNRWKEFYPTLLYIALCNLFYN